MVVVTTGWCLTSQRLDRRTTESETAAGIGTDPRTAAADAPDRQCRIGGHHRTVVHTMNPNPDVYDYLYDNSALDPCLGIRATTYVVSVQSSPSTSA